MRLGLVAKSVLDAVTYTDPGTLGIPWDGSSYQRLVQYNDFFIDMGIEVRLGGAVWDSKRQIFGVLDLWGDLWFDCDVLLMKTYYDASTLASIPRAQAQGQIIINDVDDWYWGMPRSHSAYSALDPSVSPLANKLTYMDTLKQSDGVIVSTPFLQEKLSAWNYRTLLHTNYVDLSRFRKKREHTLSDKLEIGWVGAIGPRANDIRILRRHAKKISEFAHWNHYGQSSDVPQRFHKELNISESDVSVHSWVSAQNLQFAMNFDVGLVPLVNTSFNHAKSYLKGLEYAASNVPFVASWSPEYERLKSDYGIGVVVDNPANYVTELHKLCDVDYRSQIAAENSEKVKAFDTSIGANYLIDCINTIVRDVVT